MVLYLEKVGALTWMDCHARTALGSAAHITL
jgi:hypothetical protein